MVYDLEYLIQRCTVDPVSGCWEWNRARGPNGYGRFNYNGVTKQSHRLAMALTTGVDIDSLAVVCHVCDNPPCCNPAHLFHGTHAVNRRDMVDKERHAFGERHWKSKLCDDDVREIRTRARCGEDPAGIGALFGVSRSVVQEINAGSAWARA